MRKNNFIQWDLPPVGIRIWARDACINDDSDYVPVGEVVMTRKDQSQVLCKDKKKWFVF